MFDTSPAQLARVGAPVLPARYLRRLMRYRYGPGVFKVDWALDGPIPWSSEEVRKAGTVHVGGSEDEFLASVRGAENGLPERPFSFVSANSCTASSGPKVRND